ncbi:MAG: MDR family MFS transporter [Ilumatobacteraceae bacterium]
MATESFVPGLTTTRLWMVLSALMVAVLLSSMEISITSTALPTIAGDFDAFERYAWVGTAYIAAAAIGTPLLGKLSDLYGRRMIFEATMLVFVVGSLLCGLSQSMNQLIAARAVQGFGGGAIQAMAFSILGDILPPRERGRYIGYFTLAFVGAALLGPLLGGFIIDHWSWPWIFFVNIPLATIAGIVSYVALDLPFPRRSARIDVVGAILLSIAIGSLIVSFELGASDGWTSPEVLGLWAVVLVGVALFVLVERRVPEPMIPLHLFSNRVVLMCIVAGMCAGSIAFGAGQFLPLYFQDSLFVSPTESGLRMLPQMIGVTIGTFGIGRLILRTGRYKAFPIVGCSVAAAGLFMISRITGSTPYGWLVVPMIAMGFGMAAVFTSSSIATQNAVEFHDLGVATATIMFFRSLGGSFGLAIFGTILTSTVRREIPPRLGISADEAAGLIREPADIAALPDASREAVVDSLASGVGRIFLVCSGVMIVGLAASILMPERPLRQRAGLSDALEEASAGALA